MSENLAVKMEHVQSHLSVNVMMATEVLYVTSQNVAQAVTRQTVIVKSLVTASAKLVSTENGVMNVFPIQVA